MPRRRSRERLLKAVIADRALSAVTAWCLKNKSVRGVRGMKSLRACCLAAVQAALMETEITSPAIDIEMAKGVLTVVVTGTVSLEQVRVELEVSDTR
jgi:hypothetical protein